MFTKTLSTAAVALAAASAVSAQTFTSCNPLEKDCPADPAFGNQAVDCDFTKGDCAAFHSLEGTTIEHTEQGAVFSIEKESNAPTIATNNYIFFGKLEVEVQPAPGQGVVTSLVLQSDDLDEIDWEWVGADTNQVQSNYFSKGDTSTYDRGAYHTVENAVGSSHTYTIDWTAERVNWEVNGAIVRTLKASDAKGGSAFPQTPMQIKLGTWVAGRKDAPEGTVEWAGGYTDFSKAPFNAYYKSVKITDYAGGSSAASASVKEYNYGDRTGDWESIEVVEGEGSIISAGPNDKTETKTTEKATDKETATASSTKAEITLIEPTSISKVYEKPKTTIDPSTPIPSTFIAPSSTKTTTSAAEETTTSTETETETSGETSTSDESASETTGPAETEEGAAGSVRVAVGSVVFAGAFALAQLL